MRVTRGVCLTALMALFARPAGAVDVQETSAPPATDSGSTSLAESSNAPRDPEFSVAFLAAYGSGGTYQDWSANRYRFGFGARAGVTLPAPRLFLGAQFLSFRGDKADGTERRTSVLDAEVGYDFLFLKNFLLVRPGLALGVAQVITIQSDSAAYPLGFHLAPGALVALRALPVLISGELRRDILFGEAGATTILFGAGVVL